MFEDAAAREVIRSVSYILETNHANLEVQSKCLKFLINEEDNFSEDQKKLIINLFSIQAVNFKEVLEMGCKESIQGTLIPIINELYSEMKINLALAQLRQSVGLGGGFLIDDWNHMRFPRKDLKHRWIVVRGIDGVDWGEIPDLTRYEIMEAKDRLVEYRINECVSFVDNLRVGTFSRSWHRKINKALDRESNLTNLEICKKIILISLTKVDKRLRPLIYDPYGGAFQDQQVSTARNLFRNYMDSKAGHSKQKKYFKDHYLMTLDKMSILALIDGPQPTLKELLSAFDILIENSKAIMEDHNEKAIRFETVEERYSDIYSEKFFMEVITEELAEGKMSPTRVRRDMYDIIPKFQREFLWHNAKEITNAKILSSYTEEEEKEKIKNGLNRFWTNAKANIVSRKIFYTSLLLIGTGGYIAACFSFSGGTATLACGLTAGMAFTGTFLIESYLKDMKMVKGFFSGLSGNSKAFNARKLSIAAGTLRINVFMASVFAGVFGAVKGYNVVRTIGGAVQKVEKTQ